MSAAKIANRMPRGGRNPGRRSVRGDVQARIERQRESIFHRTGRYKKRSRRNPDDEAQAERIAREFHGRPVREFIDIEEPEVYSEYAGVLGELMRLDILMADGRNAQSIEFDFVEGAEDNIFVVAPDKNNIEFVGGDQSFPWREIEGATDTGKNIVLVGPVVEIDYFADKHHLEGPKSQKHGITYFHEFGDEGGELPCLLYDTRNEKLLFVDGDYTIEPEGITG